MQQMQRAGHNSRTFPRNRIEAMNYRGGSNSARRHEVNGVLELSHFSPLFVVFKIC